MTKSFSISQAPLQHMNCYSVYVLKVLYRPKGPMTGGLNVLGYRVTT